MASPATSDLHLDVALSNIATAYRNDDDVLIGRDIFPRVATDKKSNKYYVWDKEYWLSIHVEPRAPSDTYPEGLMKLSNTSFDCEIFHLGFPIADEDLANEDAAVQLAQTAAEWLSHQFALHHEDKLATDFFKTGVWGSDKTLSGTDQWSDYANSDPIGDVDLAHQTVQKRTGKRPNTLVVGQEVQDILKMHPLLLDLYKHTGAGMLSEDRVGEALGVENYKVGAAVKNTANVAATFSGSYVWGKNALLMWVPSAAGLRIPSAGYTFVWTALDGGGGFDVPITTVREDSRDRDMIRGKHAFDQKAVGTDLAYFIAAAVAEGERVRFIVKIPMRWDGVDYEAGDRVEIADGHPRLAIEAWRRRFLTYDPTPEKRKETAKAR